jgi:hypothetical protein
MEQEICCFGTSLDYSIRESDSLKRLFWKEVEECESDQKDLLGTFSNENPVA